MCDVRPARRIVGDADVNIMPLGHIGVGMTFSRRHGMMIEVHSHISVSLGTFNLECQLHPDTQVKERKGDNCPKLDRPSTHDIKTC